MMANKNTIQFKKTEQGFTLIELMVTLGIVAILAMVAYPSYQDSVKKARRADAQSALLGFSGAMERHYTTNNTYTGAAQSGDTGAPSIYATEAPIDGGTKYYDLTITAATDADFTLRATPKSAQADDGALELTSTGTRRWDENNNGSFEATENDWQKD